MCDDYKCSTIIKPEEELQPLRALCKLLTPWTLDLLLPSKTLTRAPRERLRPLCKLVGGWVYPTRTYICFSICEHVWLLGGELKPYILPRGVSPQSFYSWQLFYKACKLERVLHGDREGWLNFYWSACFVKVQWLGWYLRINLNLLSSSEIPDSQI